MEIKVHLGTMLAMIFNFMLLMVVLIRFLYRPIKGMLAQRRQKILDDFDAAKGAKENAESLQHQARVALEEAHVEAYETVEKAKVEAERLREEMLNQATQETERIRQKANTEIERSKQVARREMRDEAVDLALMAVTKVMGQNMSKELNDLLIKGVIAQIDGEAMTQK